MVKRPEEYRWSSYPDYIGKKKKNEWLTCDWILGQYSTNEAKARSLYKEFVEAGLRIKENPFDALKKGIILGSESFIDEVRKKITIKEHREIPESRKLTRRIEYKEVIASVVKRFDISEKEIKETGRRDNLERKICLYLLRRLTDMGNEEIGEYFGIGYTAVSQAASRLKREMNENKELKKTLQDIEEELLSEE